MCDVEMDFDYINHSYGESAAAATDNDDEQLIYISCSVEQAVSWIGQGAIVKSEVRNEHISGAETQLTSSVATATAATAVCFAVLFDYWTQSMQATQAMQATQDNDRLELELSTTVSCRAEAADDLIGCLKQSVSYNHLKRLSWHEPLRLKLAAVARADFKACPPATIPTVNDSRTSTSNLQPRVQLQ